MSDPKRLVEALREQLTENDARERRAQIRADNGLCNPSQTSIGVDDVPGERATDDPAQSGSAGGGDR